MEDANEIIYCVQCFEHDGTFHSEDEVVINLDADSRIEIQSQYQEWLGKDGYVHYGAGDQNVAPQLILPTEDKVGYLEGQLFMLRNELREKFAAMAMQGLLSTDAESFNASPKGTAVAALEYADALLEVLS